MAGPCSSTDLPQLSREDASGQGKEAGLLTSVLGRQEVVDLVLTDLR